MEFPFQLASSIGAPRGHKGPYVCRLQDHYFRGATGGNLMSVLDALGKRSAAAQGLRRPITCGSTVLSDQRVYLCVEDRRALGFLKVGSKRLFVAAPPLVASKSSSTCVQDALKEIIPLCVLDFYVHESCQRIGIGKCLFDAMLEQEGASPPALGYDRPSPKLLMFLEKHFGLTRYQPQNNNFVIFDEYFSHDCVESIGSRLGSSRRSNGTLSLETLDQGGMPGSGASQDDKLHLGQRQPLAPSASTDAMRLDMGSGRSGASLHGPSSHSHASLAAVPRRISSDVSSLQKPWGTMADVPPRVSGAGWNTNCAIDDANSLRTHMRDFWR